MDHSPQWSRRSLLHAAGLILLTSWPSKGWAGDAERLSHRIELWQTFSRKSTNLVARYTSRRQSSMLLQPLQTSGVLTFVAPDRLLLRDDDARGSTTRIVGAHIEVRPNDSALPVPKFDHPQASPSLAWVRDRLLAAFAPGSREQLEHDCILRAAAGRTPRLEFIPHSGSLVRKAVRRIELTLDPVGGAVRRLVIDEAQGDSLTLEIGDHRQAVTTEELGHAFE